MDGLWSLPGPGAFAHEVLEALLSGKNVALVWPERSPEGLLEALAVSHLRGRQLVTGHLREGESPIDAIYRAALGVTPVDAARTPGELAGTSNELLSGLVVAFELTNGDSSQRWSRFLSEYSDRVRAVAPGERLLIILNHRGAALKHVPAGDVALAVVKWDGWANESDAFILASLNMRNRTASRGRRALVTACIARLAQWDLGLADELCEVAPAELVEPQAWLKEWAGRKEWAGERVPTWQAGTAHTLDGETIVHSGYLALHDPEALQRRVWSAHAGVYLPLIEQRRIELLPRLAGHIAFPLETDSGVVQSVAELEIGPLAWALRNARIDRSTLQAVERLRDARNRLAHMDPLPAGLALHKDLLG